MAKGAGEGESSVHDSKVLLLQPGGSIGLACSPSGEASITGVAEFLERFPATRRLRDVLSSDGDGLGNASWKIYPTRQTNLTLGTKNSGSWTTLYSGFPHPRVPFVVAGPVNTKTLSFWPRELENHLPMLLDYGGAVTAKCSEALVSSAPPHHDSVQALVVSPDSNGDDGNATIWDLSGSRTSACKIAMPTGHTGPVCICAWSPDGSTIATGSDGGSVRLWDARTAIYRERALVSLKGAVVSLAFSQDGSWLACGSNRGECCIVNVTLGTLRRSLWNSTSDDADADDTYSGCSQTLHQIRDTIITFHPISRSTHLATAPCGFCSGIDTVDVATGSVLAHTIGGVS
ncbi:hypothetical protein GSI_09872 [Ganoderma sinense ZZ0214-1]|uniref:Uncharacterized protein n=1 Tax=Ganoderma sinense ZZ0214-1 TaxID=1077348 RepID=A0A2G8S2P5_9APHY|nr:hypothetical protein GSI_09872 [Ganoderma sinense ZZ0214-1]